MSTDLCSECFVTAMVVGGYMALTGIVSYILFVIFEFLSGVVYGKRSG
jgi:hypothetical protein